MDIAKDKMNKFEKKLLECCPVKVNQYEKVIQKTGNDTFYVVRVGNKYIKLNPLFYQFFESMDGRKSVIDLIHQIFYRKEHPTFETISQFLALLYRNKMILPSLSEEEIIFNELLKNDLKPKTTLSSKLGQMILKSKISFKLADNLISKLYNYGGKFFFAKSSLILMFIISLVGVVSFISQLSKISLNFEKLLLFNGSYFLGLLALYLIIVMTTIIHEIAHALTCKHFNRKVLAMGFMCYYGTPACFTDTTDSWMLPKMKRIAVDGAGIISNFIMGAIFSIIAVYCSEYIPYKPMMIGAIINYTVIAVNLTPFLKFDGYYLLSDLLDKPNLREDSLVLLFASKQMWKSEVKLFLFGICSIVYTFITLCFLIVSVFLIILQFAPSSYSLAIALATTIFLISSLLNITIQKIKIYRGISV